MKTCQLASGSKGNCTLITDEESSILIDAGISWGEASKKAKAKNVDLSTVKAIILTHCHYDHWKYSFEIAKKLPSVENIFLTKKQFEYLSDKYGLVLTDAITSVGEKVKFIDSSKPSFEAAPFKVSRFEVSHDSIDSCAYIVHHLDGEVGVITDLGVVEERLIEPFKQCSVVFLESNYDIDMLINGTYPDMVIDRILSDKGHLSNLEACDFAKRLKGGATKHVVLCHISQENNSFDEISRTFSEIDGEGVPIFHVSTQKDGSDVFTVKR